MGSPSLAQCPLLYASVLMRLQIQEWTGGKLHNCLFNARLMSPNVMDVDTVLNSAVIPMESKSASTDLDNACQAIVAEGQHGCGVYKLATHTSNVRRNFWQSFTKLLLAVCPSDTQSANKFQALIELTRLMPDFACAVPNWQCSSSCVSASHSTHVAHACTSFYTLLAGSTSQPCPYMCMCLMSPHFLERQLCSETWIKGMLPALSTALSSAAEGLQAY